jgi:hypothetical protein
MPAFCHRCGARLQLDAQFCGECGVTVISSEPSTLNTGAVPAQPILGTRRTANSKGWKVLKLTFGIFVAGSVLVLVLIAITSSGDKKLTEDSAPSAQPAPNSDSTQNNPRPEETKVPDELRYTPSAEAPDGTLGVAQGVSVVPGAIICSNYRAVQVVFDLYTSHWSDTAQDAVTKGQSRLIRGDAAPAPDPTLYGCVLLPSGTPMRMKDGNAVPIVTAKMADGTNIKGVTFPSMFVPQ